VILNHAQASAFLICRVQRKLAEFVACIRGKYLVKSWRGAADLRTEVSHALREEIERNVRDGEARPGWYRGDNFPEAKLPLDDGWRRCGNIYWLGHNMLGAALSVLQRQPPHWRGAIGHARQVPIPGIYADEIRLLEKALSNEQVAADPLQRQRIAQRLLDLAKDIGRLIQSHQGDFDQRDPGPG